MKRMILAATLVLPSFLALNAAPAPIVIEKPVAPPDLDEPPADSLHQSDGLTTKVLEAGSGTSQPKGSDYVHVRYAVWKSPGGTVIDFTRSGATFVALDKLLPGMGEMIALMVPGEKRRGWIPQSLGGGKIAAGQMYVMDAELLDIVPPPAPPPDVAAPPADAVKTSSGLASRVLREGTGTVHPRKRDTVVVHYSGWTPDGQMFDSSVMKGEPAEFALTGVIAGWTEGLQLMVEGEQRRFWIPAKLAYHNEPGKPKGMLVFDIELIKIK